MADIHREVVAELDRSEKSVLAEAHDAASTAYSEHATESGSNWFGKRYTLPALVRSIRANAPGLRIRTGAGPRAARGTTATTVIVDTARSTPRKLVLHGESAGGSIWTETASPAGKPHVSRSTVVGVAAIVIPETRAFPLAAANAVDPTRVVVSVTEDGAAESTELLLDVGADGLVASMLVGAAVLPPVVGSGPADSHDLADRLVHAFSVGGGVELCALFHPQLVALFDISCTSKDTRPARDVTTDADRLASADGTSVVTLVIGSGADALTVSFLATPGVAGVVVTGLFVDVFEAAALAAQPI